ncbi:ester cyclase [Vibrio aquimaris]|uniref:SnoaL-like polyketide cyclase n=1 Tax=Vibrio aquimaris TaxID=2587862 RepID=A0A5P9CQW2_9VIBR|nr:ester cyclase [Vibrio aquimaris]QFT28596.1 SnoaL-like polyketide cyclase [Vibrio aquimaris]
MKENIALVQDFYTDVFINRDFSRCEEYMDENYINNSNFVDNGRDGFIDYFSNYSKKFPNGSASIEKILSSDDHVFVYANHWTKILGITLKYKAIDIYEIKNNKIKEHWDSVEGINGISIFIFMIKRIFGL